MADRNDDLRFFSPDYATARRRFRAAAEAVGAKTESHPIEAIGPEGEALAIDVALVGDPSPRRVVVVSSGLHGVEGFFGSAVQLALLEGRLAGEALPAGASAVLIHGLNPYGFAWRRRFNEENVDLNRNFLLEGEEFAGSPPLYPTLDRLFNPTSPPRWWEPFGLKAAWAVLRHGMKALRETLPVGQYDYPKGLFFGGKGPAAIQRILTEHLPQWIGDAEEVVHVDFHTGLGRWGDYQLMLSAGPDHPAVAWFREHFDPATVSALGSPQERAARGTYAARGSLDKWCTARFADRRYLFAGAEFGTYGNLRVVAALRAENRATHWAPPGDPCLERARRRLVEVFCPADPRWRRVVVRQGLEIVGRAMGGPFRPSK